jgi:hypothetical protein
MLPGMKYRQDISRKDRHRIRLKLHDIRGERLEFSPLLSDLQLNYIAAWHLREEPCLVVRGAADRVQYPMNIRYALFDFFIGV